MLSSDPLVLQTKRLSLVQCSIRQMEKLIEGPEVFAAAFGHPVVDGYRGFPESLELALAKMIEPNDDADWCGPCLCIRQQDGAMVGLAGLKGLPDAAGVAEIGYAIAPSCRGQGLATEIVETLVRHLLASDRVSIVRAHTLPGPSASSRVLEKCGFERVEDEVDAEDGPVWRWERTRQVL